jgi:hypothetical protein
MFILVRLLYIYPRKCYLCNYLFEVGSLSTNQAIYDDRLFISNITAACLRPVQNVHYVFMPNESEKYTS